MRRLISRNLAGSRQEIDIKSDLELGLQIWNNEYWCKEIADNDEKDNELKDICHKDIKIGHALDLYNVLDGDTILNKFIDQSKKKEKENDINEENKNKEGNEIINTEETQADEIKENDDEENNADINEENEDDNDNDERDDY